MPKKEIKNEGTEDIFELIRLMGDDDTGLLGDNNGNAGFMNNESYGLYETIETVAMALNPEDNNYMSKIAAMAIGYDKRSNFDRAKDVFTSSYYEDGFAERIRKTLRFYRMSIISNSPNESIDTALDAYFKTYSDRHSVSLEEDTAVVKNAQSLELDAAFVAQRIFEIIKIMVSRMKLESRPKSMNSIRNKIRDFNIIELSNKKSPGGAAVGVSLALIKNILISRDTFFIKRVLDELDIILR